MIREVGEAIGRAVLDGIGRAASRVQERKPLPADLLESETAYLVIVDAPGATASNVSVRFHRNALQVRIDRTREFHDEYELRFPGRGLALAGTVSFPEAADVAADAADATLTDEGTLEVLIPKSGHEDSVGESTPLGANRTTSSGSADVESVDADGETPAERPDSTDDATSIDSTEEEPSSERTDATGTRPAVGHSPSAPGADDAANAATDFDRTAEPDGATVSG